MTTLTVESFWAELSVKPDDWALRQVFADYLTDAGDQDMAFCQLWMAAHKRHADVWSVANFFSGQNLYGWWDLSVSSNHTPKGPEDLPKGVWDELDLYETRTNDNIPLHQHNWRWYKTRQLGDEALCRALKSLRSEGKLQPTIQQ